MIKKKGFTLLESILVLTIAGITATMAVQQSEQKFQRRLATVSGKQIRQIGEATDAYITHNYSDWPTSKTKNVQSKNASSLSANQPGGPRTCYSDGTCRITVKTLVSNGYLPRWNPNLVNPLNSHYAIIIKKKNLSNSTMPLLSSLVVTKKPYTPTGNSNNINYAMLGRALQAAGSQAGYSRNMGNCTSYEICGYGGSFHVNGRQYHNVVNQSGQLGFFTSISQGFLNDQYLRRDGTLPMYGDLYMGEHNIYNVHRIQGTSKQNISQKHELSSNNTPTKNEISTMRMGNIMVSTNPKKLPKVNANPHFETASNVPTLLKGNVSITANKTVVSNDNTPGNNNFIAIFRKNPGYNQTRFAVGYKAKTTFNNQTKQSVNMKGGLHFKSNGRHESITRGTDGLNAYSNSSYDNNTYNFSGYTGKTPVNVMDSLSVAGVITNRARYGRKDGVNIMDNNYIDLTAYNSSRYGQLQKPGSSGYYLSTKPSQGWVNIGANRHRSRTQTGLTVKNGPVFVGGSNSCNYAGYGANSRCRRNSSSYPKSGEISANDYYIRNYKHPNEPLSKILNNRSGVTIKRIGDFGQYAVVPKPNCSQSNGSAHAAVAAQAFPTNKANSAMYLADIGYGWEVYQGLASCCQGIALVITFCSPHNPYHHYYNCSGGYCYK